MLKNPVLPLSPPLSTLWWSSAEFTKVQSPGVHSQLLTWGGFLTAPHSPTDTATATHHHHHHYQESTHSITDWDQDVPLVFLNIQYNHSFSQEDPIWIKDLYGVLTRIIPHHIADPQCPIVDEKLRPVFERLLYRHLVFLHREHIYGSSGKLFPAPQQMAAGVGHHLDVHRSSKSSRAQRCVLRGITYSVSSGKESYKKNHKLLTKNQLYKISFCSVVYLNFFFNFTMRYSS